MAWVCAAAELSGQVIIKQIWPSSLSPCSGYCCYIANCSKTECEKQELFQFAHDFENCEFRKGPRGAFPLGFFMRVQSDVVWAAVLWRFDSAACPGQVTQVAGPGCWLSSGSSAGAVNRNIDMCPLQVGSLKIIRFLVWRLVSPVQHPRRT